MIWVPDRTGRFHKRPHYEPAELNAECEKLVLEFLVDRHGSVRYPISTDDLTVLLESLTQDLDIYADLTKDGEDVEGVTDFFPGKRPRVRISNRLSTENRLENRLRTTLTHELGHVKFHTHMFDVERPQSLFASSQPEANKCNRDSIIGAGQSDWMEWQAGFACGAFLMPCTALSEIVEVACPMEGRFSAIGASSHDGLQLISNVADHFKVSRDAARVRLLQQGVLSERPLSGNLV